MSQQLLHHRRQAMGSASVAKAAQARRQAIPRSALLQWDGQGGAEPDGPEEGGRQLLRVLDNTHVEKPLHSFDVNGANT